MIRFYNENDINGVIRLWEEAFGDSENEIRFFLDSCRKPLNTLVYEINGEIASMLFLLEGDMHFEGNDFPSYYLYAACTLKKYRGRGLMAELLNFAKETANKNRKCFICLKPAEKSLFDFYEKNGYKTVFTVKVAEYHAENSIIKDVPDNEINPESLRNAAYDGRNYFKWDRQSVEFAFLHNKFFGGNSFASCKGYSLYTSVDAKTTVKETTFTDVDFVLNSISENRETTEIIFPPWIDTEGEIKPWAMITAVNDESKKIVDLIDNAYLGLTLD
ncbi:MAG: GNAT family N-acetyltransferase [Ruminococcaceae bacterium]|nr:GNAT family N-acetyltransferase [Oscillospiraceae bacterium]